MGKGKTNRLGNKMFLLNIAVLFPFIILINVLSVGFFSRQQRETAEDALLAQSYNSQIYVMKYIRSSVEDDKANYLAKLAPYLAHNLSQSIGLRVQILQGEELLADSEENGVDVPVSGDVEQAAVTKAYEYFQTAGTWYISFSSPVYGDQSAGDAAIGVIRYLYPLNTEENRLKKLALLLVGLSAAAGLLSLMMNKVVSGEIVRSVQELQDKVSKMKKGNLSQRVELDTGDELQELGEAFNLMSRRLEEYVARLDEQQKQLGQFFNSATHQLKTPLTSIIGYSQMIQLHSDNDEVCDDAFTIEEEGEHLLRSIELMLDESREKLEWRPTQIENYSLRELIDECRLSLNPRLKKQAIVFSNRCDERVFLRNDRSMAKEAVLVLLDNAIVHSGCKTLTVFHEPVKKDGEVLLHIVDDGCGIRKQEADLIFKPFYRSANVMGRGNGLGLSMCSSLMKQLGGSVELKVGQEKGAEFVLLFKMLYL